MRLNKPTALLITLLVCGSVTSVRAQEPDASKFDQLAFGIAAAKAQSDCLALWADHALDPLRDKIALGIDATLPMLANRERLRPQDKRVMDLIIKALHRCRAAYDPALAILPPGDTRKVEGIKQEQDALIADLNSGKITFGDYNTAVVRVAVRHSPRSSHSPIKPRSQLSLLLASRLLNLGLLKVRLRHRLLNLRLLKVRLRQAQLAR